MDFLLRTFVLVATTSLLFSPIVLRADPSRLQPGEAPYSLSELKDLTDGNTLVFADDSRATFSRDGSFSFIPANRNSMEFGMFELYADGRICVTLAGGFDRCDLYVKGKRATLVVTDGGDRLPFRIIFSLKE